MYELPTWIKKALDAVGINSSRVQWKIHYMLEGMKEKKNPMGGKLHWMKRRQKLCMKCGAMMSEDERVCASCGARAPSRLGYLLKRTLGMVGFGPGVGVTSIFIGIFVVMYLLIKYQSATIEGTEGSYSARLIVWGALFEPVVNEYNQYWRIMTMALLHGGLIHLFFNSFALLQLGPLIEHEAGPWRTLVVITVTQISAAVASLMFHNPAFSVGASGFLFGLIGFGYGFFVWQKTHAARIYSRICMQWGIYALLFGLIVPGIDNAAHIGGAVAGIAIGWLWQFLPSPYHSRAMQVGLKAAGIFCIFLWIACFALMLLGQKTLEF